MNSQRSMSREIGTALAVLAMYLFTLLAPLHEARASQLGYTTLQTGWVLCSSAKTSDQDGKIAVSKCPVTGVGKPAAIAPGLIAMAPHLRPVMLAAPRPLLPVRFAPAPIAPPAGPRAPPVVI
ncbi:MAG: hypothetical protein ACOH2M_22965 [Cypionkella sp.]